MAYSPNCGDQITDDYDLDYHWKLKIPVDIEDINGLGTLTTGIIESFDDKMIIVNNHAYNRHSHLIISRPNS